MDNNFQIKMTKKFKRSQINNSTSNGILLFSVKSLKFFCLNMSKMTENFFFSNSTMKKFGQNLW